MLKALDAQVKKSIQIFSCCWFFLIHLISLIRKCIKNKNRCWILQGWNGLGGLDALLQLRGLGKWLAIW